MSRPGLRVYFITHLDGRRTGILMRRKEYLFDHPPPSAYGLNEEDVLNRLELKLAELSGDKEKEPDGLGRYFWTESFSTRRVTVDTFPLSRVKDQPVIGKKQVPLKLMYACSALPSGGYRVMLPRFGWWFILEDLETASEVIKSAISTALLGENPRWAYEFRIEGEEYVRVWHPDSISARYAQSTSEDLDYPNLRAIAEELVERVSKKKLLPVVGEDPSFEASRPLYSRDPPASLLLVGGAGVGKSTWVRRLAKHLALKKKGGKKRPTKEHVSRIWSTSGDRIIAGMVYVGMWQKRCLNVLEELSYEGDYLYVDRLTSILKTQSDGSSIADLFAPALGAEEISLIAECSEPELERCRQRFPSFLSHFRIIQVPEAPPAAMPGLLRQYQAKKRSRVTIHPQGMKRLVQHLEMFAPDRSFPGKAFRFIDWMARDQDQRTPSDPPEGSVLFPSDVSRAFSAYSGLPVEIISDELVVGTQGIQKKLTAKVVGQDAPCTAAARVLARFKAGLNDPTKPTGSLFFVGPTGVGKTELAKQLTKYLFGDEKRVIRLDMSEYMIPGSAQRLLEVGEGLTTLAELVRQQPLSLVLLDEIEKAHPEVFDLLLGILGEGRLTDTLGRLIDFRMTIIIMTSNLGARASGPVGFGASSDSEGSHFISAVREHFRPEFFNRIDQVVAFRRLSLQDIERIVLLEIEKLRARTGLKRRNIKLRIEPEARSLLAERGHHPDQGARPLKRVIEELVITPVAVKMARSPSFRDLEVRVIPEGRGPSSQTGRDRVVTIPRVRRN